MKCENKRVNDEQMKRVNGIKSVPLPTVCGGLEMLELRDPKG